MANVLVEESSLQAIADTIRSKLGVSDTYLPSEMAGAINDIGGGITPTGTKQISISQNGTTTEDVAAYASAQITANVPNSYTQADEGKVVSNGALVSQSSDTVTDNGTYDTTLINSLEVDVASGGGASIEDAMNGTLTGDIVINVTDPLPIDNTGGIWGYTAYGFLFMRSAIDSLVVNGLLNVPNRCCYKNTHVKSASFPDATVLGGNDIFSGCTNLQSANFPKVINSYYNYAQNGTSMFASCSNLTSVNMRQVDRIAQNMFNNCTSLALLEFNQITHILAQAFKGASSLATLIIRSSAVPSLANINAFENTPFASGKAGGTLYVPSALISSYQSATNWSTILGYANNSIQAIEGSIYETHYADGTVIA